MNEFIAGFRQVVNCGFIGFVAGIAVVVSMIALIVGLIDRLVGRR